MKGYTLAVYPFFSLKQWNTGNFNRSGLFINLSDVDTVVMT